MVSSLFAVSILSILIVLTNSSDKFDLTKLTHSCTETKATVSNYDPLGKTITIGNISVYEYETPNNINKKRMLINAYDIYGMENANLKQVSDQIAAQSGGFLVAQPDFFRGDYWRVDRDPDERAEWADRVTDWNRVVKPDLINLVQYYRQNRGIEEFGILGFCWGGKVAELAAIHMDGSFKASAIVHPSSIVNEEAEEIKIPTYLMPAQTDLDMSEFYKVLQRKFGDNCGHRRFDNMPHGFAGARGNFSDPLVRASVDEVIEKLGIFFDRNLNETKQQPSNSVKLQPYVIAMTVIAFVLFI